MRLFGQFRRSSASRTPYLPKGGPVPPGQRLTALRAAAERTGWGAGIAAQAMLVGAVSIEEDARIAAIHASLAAAALVIAGYEVMTFGVAPPLDGAVVAPLAWGDSAPPELRKRFDGLAVDATTLPPAGEWLNGVFARLGYRSQRTRLAILCGAADVPHYTRACTVAYWDITAVPTRDDAPATMLLTSARLSWGRA